jgi:DNA-binding transcriptional LysR family regulator
VHTWLARFLEQVHARHPGITLDISVDVSPNLRDALAGAELDLAFLLGPVSEPRMVNHPLARYPLAFAASPDLDLGPEPVGVEALLRFPVITYPKTTRPYIVLREILRRPDLPAPRLYSSASLSTIVRMTLDRIGVSCIPPAVIGPELADGRLRLVETDLPLPDLAFTATYPVAPDSGLARAAATLACEVAGAAAISGAYRSRSERTIGSD